jgi:hypothetical protein
MLFSSPVTLNRALPRRRLGMAIRQASLVSLPGEEVTPMASHKPALPREAIPREEEGLSQAGPTFRTGILKKFDPRILHQPQGPDSGLNAVMGKWPGDETDEEILALLEELS